MTMKVGSYSALFLYILRETKKERKIMAKEVQISVTYLFTYEEDELKERFDDLVTDEDFIQAARIKLFNENMNDFEPNDVEIEVVERN